MLSNEPSPASGIAASKTLSDLVASADRPATPEMFAFADRFFVEAEKNVDLLREDAPDELTACLQDWGIVLLVLALDVFDARNYLLKAGKLRAAQMLQRPLIDYAIRLRYYVVQSIKLRRALSSTPPVDVQYLKPQMYALIDWEQAHLSLGRQLAKYDVEFWPDEAKDKMVQYVTDRNNPSQRSTSDMVQYLLDNECSVRGVLREKTEEVERHYRNLLPEWSFLSLLLHGDQGIVSESLDFDDAGKKTGTVWRHPPVNGSSTFLLSGVNQMIHLNQTIAILRGWAYGTRGALAEAADIWTPYWKKFKDARGA